MNRARFLLFLSISFFIVSACTRKSDTSSPALALESARDPAFPAFDHPSAIEPTDVANGYFQFQSSRISILKSPYQERRIGFSFESVGNKIEKTTCTESAAASGEWSTNGGELYAIETTAGIPYSISADSGKFIPIVKFSTTARISGGSRLATGNCRVDVSAAKYFDESTSVFLLFSKQNVAKNNHHRILEDHGVKISSVILQTAQGFDLFVQYSIPDQSDIIAQLKYKKTDQIPIQVAPVSTKGNGTGSASPESQPSAQPSQGAPTWGVVTEKQAPSLGPNPKVVVLPKAGAISPVGSYPHVPYIALDSLEEAIKYQRLAQVSCADKNNCPASVGMLVTQYGSKLTICSATKISSDFVVTNTHCLPKPESEIVRAYSAYFHALVYYPETATLPAQIEEVWGERYDTDIDEQNPRQNFDLKKLHVSHSVDRPSLDVAQEPFVGNNFLSLFPVDLDPTQPGIVGVIREKGCIVSEAQDASHVANYHSGSYPILNFKDCNVPLIAGNEGAGLFPSVGEPKTLMGLVSVGESNSTSALSYGYGPNAYCMDRIGQLGRPWYDNECRFLAPKKVSDVADDQISGQSLSAVDKIQAALILSITSKSTDIFGFDRTKKFPFTDGAEAATILLNKIVYGLHAVSFDFKSATSPATLLLANGKTVSVQVKSSLVEDYFIEPDCIDASGRDGFANGWPKEFSNASSWNPFSNYQFANPAEERNLPIKWYRLTTRLKSTDLVEPDAPDIESMVEEHVGSATLSIRDYIQHDASSQKHGLDSYVPDLTNMKATWTVFRENDGQGFVLSKEVKFCGQH